MSLSDYTIINQIGKGSFGKIYEVEDNKTKIHYALKEIEIEGLSKEDLESIEQEKKMLIQMECEYSTELITTFQDSQYVYFLLELCDSTLGNEIKKENGFSIEKIKEVTRQLNKVFKLMELKNIIHRDLKPENILIKYKNKEKTEFDIKLADYGLSRKLRGNSNAITICGTPMTMAPEILLEKPYDSKADLWSIGIIIYLMYFNDLPFDKNNYLRNVIGDCNMKQKTKDDDLNNLLENLLKRNPIERMDWEEYFKHSFFQYDQNLISAVFDINKNDLNDFIQIINCYEEAKNENSVINEGIDNSKEIANNCTIYINKTKIGFCYKYKFPKEGKYEIKYVFKKNLKHANYLFANCSSLFSVNFCNFNSNEIKGINGMFFGCSKLDSLNINSFNTSFCSNMEFLFFGCKKLKNLDLSNFNTQNVKNMNSMFFDCSNLQNLIVSNFDTQNVTNMNCMFYKCTSLKTLNLSSFNTSNVTIMVGMFFFCINLTNLNLSSFSTQNVKEMNIMFYGCSNLKNLNCCNFTSDNVKDYQDIFQACSSLENLDLSNFKVQNKDVLLKGINKNCNIKIK